MIDVAKLPFFIWNENGQKDKTNGLSYARASLLHTQDHRTEDGISNSHKINHQLQSMVMVGPKDNSIRQLDDVHTHNNTSNNLEKCGKEVKHKQHTKKHRLLPSQGTVDAHLLNLNN